MKILGIGVDVIKNKRIQYLINKKSFIKRTFGKNEVELSKKTSNKINYFAKRFAAKEAFAKSLGTGIRNNLNFKDIEILNDNLGKPYFRLNKKIKTAVLKNLNVKNFDTFLSISDEKNYSIAFTIIQTKNV